MNKLIIDAANENIFFMIIGNKDIYNVSHENSKTNYEKLMVLIINFYIHKTLKISDISTLYVNGGPGSFAGIRNSLSVVKAIHLTREIDYYCYSLKELGIKNDFKYENVPSLCDKFKVGKKI